MAGGFRGDIQGLRAIAVLLVVLYHGGVPFLSGGYVGVDVFFVISGFLITSHLWGEISTRKTLDFASFYARRARRILPAALAVIALTVVGGMIFMPPLQLPQLFRDAIASALYYPNFKFALDGTNYLAETAPSPFQHYWSLGIEEQFYLFWPLVLVVFGGWLSRGSRRWAVTTTAGLTLLSFAACVWLTPRSEVWAFFFTGTRVWEFGLGALLAFFAAHRASSSAHAWLGSGAAALGLLCIITAGLTFDSRTAFPGYASLLPTVGASLVILGGIVTPANAVARVLSIRPMQFVGLISYSLYLVHWPMLVIPQAAVGLDNPLPITATLLLSAAGVPVAWILYRFVESPARTAKVLMNGGPKRTLLVTAITTAAIVICAQVGQNVSAHNQLATTLAAPEYQLQEFPAGMDYVPSNLHPSLWQVEDDLPVTYNNGCHVPVSASTPANCVIGMNPAAPLVVLFGDSHAAQWYPALARLADDGIIRLQNHTKSGCQSIDVPASAQCQKWRTSVLDQISESSDLSLIILSNYDHGEIYSDDEFVRGLDSLQTRIGDRASLLRIVDTPRPRWTPAICLSAHLENASDCDLNPANALVAPATRAPVADVPTVDLTSYFCNSRACPVIIDNLLVYRDDSHVTAAFAEALAPLIRDAIIDALPSSPLQ